MKRCLLILCVVGVVWTSHAAEWNPARQTVPESFIHPQGKRFSIFGGDPSRVQKANEIKVQDFEAKLDLVKKDYSLANLISIADRDPALELSFIIHNKAKRSYILSFPDAQRYDFMIRNSTGEVVYVWSEDKVFVKEVGKIFINPNERITLVPSPEINLAPALPKLKPGVYKVIAILSNYPEIKAESDWLLKP